MSLWEKIKSWLLDNKSIRQEFAAILEQEQQFVKNEIAEMKEEAQEVVKKIKKPRKKKA